MATVSTATLSPREFLATLPLAYKAELFNELVKDQIGSNVVWPYVPTMPKHPLRPDHPPPTTAADVDRIERVFDSPDHFIDMEAFSIRRTIQAGAEVQLADDHLREFLPEPPADFVLPTWIGT